MTDHAERLQTALDAMPLVAILRGVRPDEVVALGEVLVEAGIGVIEVPLNSPDPFDSIEALATRFAGTATVIGAGTVTDPAAVTRLADVGGELVVMPHADTAVIGAAVVAGLACVPGVVTPTEAFAALRAGAHALKVFPAELAEPAVVKAVLTVLPAGTRLLPVGGITPERMAGYWAAGARGFGLGSGLYRPGMTPDTLSRRAWQYSRAADRLRHGGVEA